jgi:ATP-binding cassette, subfamily B, bacterial CvaB/MchF/RaxB
VIEFEWPWSNRARPMLQAEGAECGLACIAMVAAHYGHKVNIGGLRRRFPISMKGATLHQLIEVASQLELAPRALRLELEEIGQLQLPAILHWDLNHFVVLERVTRKNAVVLDPAMGRVTMPLSRLSKHFTGVALELTPSPDFKPVDARVRTRLSDLWSRLTGYGGATVQVLVLSLLLQVTALALPFFIQLTIDEAVGQSDTSLLALLVLGFAIVYLLSTVVRSLRAWVVLTLGQSISFQLGGNVVRHMLRLPTSYFESRHVGDLLSRIQSVAPIQQLLTQGIVNAVIDAFLAITTLIVMALIDVRLALIVAGATLLYMAFRIAIFPAVRRRTEEEIVATAGEQTYLMETMRSMRAIKLHVHETVRENGWRNRYADVISADYRSEVYKIWTRLAESVINNGHYLIVVFFAASAVIANEITIGAMLAFLAYRSSFIDSASAMFDHVERWRLLGVHLERLSDIVGEQKEPLLPAPARPANAQPPAIRAEKLGFSYTNDDAAVLKDMSFEIPGGRFVAIVGASGAGKSTLMRILLGLLSPTRGKLTIDGTPLGPASFAAWRQRIGAVMQDDQLLSGTLADNISFFDDRPDQSRIESAAKLARIHTTIMEMPMAYQSLVGDMGAALSAGQRQRVMLARALYRCPDALFLDEGTANLDEETERAIAEMIAGLPFTRVVIAHRPILIERADIVLRLKDGAMELVEDRRRPARLTVAGGAGG